MADAVVQVQPDSTGKMIDSSSLTVGSNTVLRQRANIADPSTAAAIAAVMASAPAGTEYALVVRPASLPALAAGTNKIGTVDIAGAPATAKGTQGALGAPVQALKDSGRTSVVLNASGIATVATIALVTMQKYVGGTVTTGVTDYTVSTGKTLRVQSIVITMRPTTPSTTVTFASCTFALRRNANAAVATGSSLVATATGSVATNTPSIVIDLDIPDGLEFASTDHIGVTQVGTTGGTFDLTLIGFEY